MNDVGDSMALPRPSHLKYGDLFRDIEAGRMKIPVFQRSFVWTRKQVVKLLDSILRGYPIGTFIIWKTQERLRHLRNIGNVKLPEPPKGDMVQYVLDGQQRITSLFATRRGCQLPRKSGELDFTKIVVDLSADPSSESPLVYSMAQNAPEGAKLIPVHELLATPPHVLWSKYRGQEQQLTRYHRILEGYEFSVVYLDDRPLEVAVDVFNRLNVNGQPLSDFEIMTAKTYEPDVFDLAAKARELLHGERGLESTAGFEVPHQTILQCVAAVCGREVSREAILKLNKQKFVAAWPEVEDGLRDSVDYIRSSLGVPASKLLPYNGLLVLLTYFFVKAKRKPTASQKKELLRLFSWIVYAKRYAKSQGSRLQADLKRVDAIVKGQKPSYDEPVRLTAADLIATTFKTGDGLVRGILWLLASKRPLSLADNSEVSLDNKHLKQSNSANYHHFFPRSYLHKRGVDPKHANSVVNIVLVDDYLNKRVISAREPSDYIGEFRKENPQLAVALASHMIGKLNSFGIASDNYDRFLKNRAQKLMSAIRRRLGSDLLVAEGGHTQRSRKARSRNGEEE